MRIDVHSHVYLPRYLDMLRARTVVPRVADSPTGPRLIILPGEDTEASTGAGRPIGGEYVEPQRKIAYMDAHDIDISVISLANPWLDFLGADEAVPLARALNDDLEQLCAESRGRLFGFGVLPLHAPAAAAAELRRIATLPHLRGAIIGASMTGTTLDDPAFDVLWAAAEETGQFLFVHPHHGVGNEGFHGTGHALFLALGFTFETTTAIARLILAGVLERFPGLKLLVSHAGGTIPFLAGRLDSCVATDAHMSAACRSRPHTTSSGCISTPSAITRRRCNA